MSAEPNSTAHFRNGAPLTASGHSIVGLDCRILKSRSSRVLSFSHAQSKASVSFRSMILSHSSVMRSSSSGSITSRTTM